MKKEGHEFKVECHECGARFDFADYLADEDYSKHIAEIVLEKCGGDLILCKNCNSIERKNSSREFIEKFTKEIESLRTIIEK